MKWRILIVDDEPDVRLIVKTTLQDKYEIVEAHDGLDALEKIERYEPDFVVMDVMMPLMDGFEACQAIRRTREFKDIPVMFLSALGKTDDIKKGYSSGANLYLTKPFDPPRLLKNIDVFFETTPPPQKRRVYSFEQIQAAEQSGKVLSSGSNRRPSPVPPSGVGRPAAQAPDVIATPEGVLPRVLVVDDDSEICGLIRLTLMDLFEVVFAADGMEAIERLVKYQPDILVIDVMLPKMNGYQLCQSMRSNRAFARMPILMCSAKGSDKDISLAKRIGANDYLVKPFSGTDLLRKMEEMKTVPGFRIRPKTFTYDQILQIEQPSNRDDVFDADEESVRSRGGGAKNIKSFLAKESKKSATDRDEAPDKKKRRMFGFGGKD